MGDDECENNFVFQQIGNLLSSSHELSFNILRNLSFKDLLSASQVCQMWSRICHTIINKERRLRHAVFHPQCYPTTVSKGSLSSLPDPKKAFESFLAEEKFKMMDGCLTFSNNEWLFRDDILTGQGSKASTLSSVMTRLLPSSCQLGLISATGIIGTAELLEKSPSKNGSDPESSNEESTSDSFALTQSAGYSVEIEEDVIDGLYAAGETCTDSISIILFPRQPGVKINVSFIDNDNISKNYFPSKMKGSMILPEKSFNSFCNISAEDTLKAFILIYSEHTSFVECLGHTAVHREKGEVAFGGGLVRAVQQKTECQNGVLAISFSGCNVKANSIVIPPNVKKASMLEVYLQKFKMEYSPESQSICFLFACCGRGQLWYRRNSSINMFTNVEAGTFRKIFPDVPLIGFFGEGEAGRNYIPTYDSTDEKPRKKKKRELFHQFTSIFVLVSVL